jgi:purine-binding chemotaxis protein CheW
LLGLPAGQPNAGWRVVVARIEASFVGLLVDRVTGILQMPENAIDPVPSLLARGTGEAPLDGVCRLKGGRLMGLLSTDGLFDSTMAARIRSESGPVSSGISGPTRAASALLETEQLFVVFRLGDEDFGVPIEAVDEVVKHPGVLTHLPKAPAFLEGIMNLRGQAIPVVDTSHRFGVRTGETRRGHVVVLTVDGAQTGFAVDSVSGVMRVPSSALRAAPRFAAEDGPVFDKIAFRREGRLILLISAKALLQEAEDDLLASLAVTRTAGDPARS